MRSETAKAATTQANGGSSEKPMWRYSTVNGQREVDTLLSGAASAPRPLGQKWEDATKAPRLPLALSLARAPVSHAMALINIKT